MERDQGSAAPPSSPQDHLHAITDEAGALLSEAKHQGTEQYEHYRTTAAEQLTPCNKVHARLHPRCRATTAWGFPITWAKLPSGWAILPSKSAMKVLRTCCTEGLAWRGDNPALFLAGSVAAGFALSRFLRASASHATTAPSPVPGQGSSEPRHAAAPMPDRASDVSTHKPYTPVDPVGMGGGTPVSGGPLERDPLKGGE